MLQYQENIAAKTQRTKEEVLRVRHLNKSFGANHVLKDFELTLNGGEIMIVLGKSGSGKSVLIKCIIGLLQPDSGVIEVLGEEITALDHDALDKIRAKVGFLFQSNALYDSMTVRQNIEFPLRRHWIQITQQEVDHMVQEALEDVGLAHTIDMMPAELSGGMQKRIALARTLILKPAIILYDEPTAGLDPITGREIIDLILHVRKKYKSSALIISHDMNCVRLTADRVIVLFEGRAYAEGHYQTLERSADPEVKKFFQ